MNNGKIKEIIKLAQNQLALTDKVTGETSTE